MNTLTVITLCLCVSFVFSELFFRIKYPRVIGQIIAGLVLGLPFFRSLISQEFMIDIQFLADLGIIFLLLLVGLEINIDKFKRSEKDTIIIALSTVLVPFVLGFIFMKAMGYSYVIALIVGACFSLTAEGTTLKILLDLGALNTKIGLIILGAGLLDDIFEVIFLSAVLVMAHESIIDLVWLPLKITVFVIFVVVCYKVFPILLKHVQKEKSKITIFSFILLFALIVAIISDSLELG
ncbi:cation:proton antiporter, partial [Candidatus Woesearchaeota archaeon]|nr:cation:proton antiporter [Candidatus Woesearchaeota archaeon]